MLDDLEINPTQGISIGNNCFKITISIKSKGKVNSGGARVITNVLVTEAKVFLLSIYDKSDKENLTDGELIALLKLL